MLNAQEEEEAQSSSQPVGLTELGTCILARILEFLSIKDICTVVQTFRAFRDAATIDAVWRCKALEAYPPETVLIEPLAGYSSHKVLLIDDNALNASLVLPLNNNVACDYKYNRADYFFECCITKLQWVRSTDVLRVFFDARGESDLRDALTSSLGATVHRPSTPSRRELRSLLVHLSVQRSELLTVADRLEPAITSDPDAAKQHHSTLRALHLTTSRMLRAHQELHDAPNLGFGDLLTVLRPCGHHFVVAKPGHYKGYLEFENISQVETLADSLPPSYRLKGECARHGIDIIFCYANPVPLMPHSHMVDYHPVQLLTLPPNSSPSPSPSPSPSLLKTAFKEGQGRYALHDEPLRRMENETEAEVEVRWSHIDAELLNRRVDLPPWGGAA